GADIVPVALDQVAPCAGGSVSADQPFSGTPFSIRGQLQEPVLQRVRGWGFQGPRQRQTWPLVGAFTDALRNDLGTFGGPTTLPGSWSRPAALHLSVSVGTLWPPAEIESARPPSVAG